MVWTVSCHLSLGKSALPAIVPMIGSLRTNHWYAPYRSLVHAVPNTGTTTEHQESRPAPLGETLSGRLFLMSVS
ncbi:MAG: hypothetical protein SPI30_00755 [Prevotella sp.]|nr:hypothetical protein [Prevotella sp.]